MVFGAFAAAAALAIAFYPRTEERERPSLSAVPPGLFDAISAWPTPDVDLPPSTPLAPLLAADAPTALAVLSPGEGATRLSRGQSLWVRFNRPMVRGAAVGAPIEGPSPLVFHPPLAGEARWTSRSTLSFTPAAWPRGVREVALSFAPELASLSGELLLDGLERVLVLDGAPRVLTHASQGTVVAGASLPLVFDAPVSLGDLRRELLAYEIGGGRRSLPVSFRSAGRTSEGFQVDVRLGRALEPGAQIALALSPRYQAWGGLSPAVMSYQVAPRPHIEGIGCGEGAAYVGQCAHAEAPGVVVDIGPTLRLLASAKLADLSPSHVHITPPLPELSLRLAPHGPPARRLIEIGGEWEPDQVYEVRVRGLVTEGGEPVRALAPLAVRSAGHPPQIRVATGNLAYEHDAAAVLPFSAIHPGGGEVVYRPVGPDDTLRALVSPSTFVREGGSSEPLAPLAPGARPNRWGEGRFSWRDAERDARMAVVSLRPDPSASARGMTAFLQSTDLGVTARASAEGLLIWVTRISSAEPVRGAEVTVADAQGRALRRDRTDADGVARIALEASPLITSHAIRVSHGEDRAALLLDPRTAVRPASMGLTPGATTPTDAPVATVFTDRGAYRPGEGVRAKIVLRRIEGARAEAVQSGEYEARLLAPGVSAPIAARDLALSRLGTAAVHFDLPLAAGLGTWRIAITRRGGREVLGETELRVAEFRQPTFRVDLGALDGPLHAGDRIDVEARATYLFGANVAGGALAWSLVRMGAAPYPERWSRYTFTRAAESADHGTLAAGRATLSEAGTLQIEAELALNAPVRTRLALEAEVTDGAGHTHAARRTFVAYPAGVEVGVKQGPDWVALGEPLTLEAVAIDHEGEPVAERPIAARFVREGWHSWWEWASASDGARDGRYQLRRDQRRQIVHRCALVSGAEPASCAFTPTRPGTYLLEAEVEDAAGRTSIASRRLYVAGPDEQPDRDPPGAPITVTPVRTDWTVGEHAELAFESPFETAEALITVEQEGVLHVERRRVEAGGHVVRVLVREDMVPSATVGVTLVKPRTGPPGERIDLAAPDLRFGVAELRVQPASAALNVTLEVPRAARPGDEVPVTVRVRDAAGRPVRGEVALWAVDEGTLRLTGYQVPDPIRGLYRPRPAAFAWEDLRRALVSRIELPALPRPSGDGGQGTPLRPLEARERFDPTPLWAPALTTDARGEARVTLTLPSRPTEYRVMAVALDGAASSGRASTSLLAEQPLVLRSALPRFLTAGDAFEASAFVHNTSEAPLEARVWTTVDGARREARAVTIPPGGEVRIAEPVVAPAEGPLRLRFEARAGDERAAIDETLAVAPRGRFVRSRVVGAAEGPSELTVGLPEGTTHGGARVTVAAHPFIGLDAIVERLSASHWAGTEPHAAAVLALASYAALDVGEAPGLSAEEVDARGRAATARLAQLQNVDGGFGRWSSIDGTSPASTTIATSALAAAAARGWLDDEAVLRRAQDQLVGLANGAAFGDHYGSPGADENAYALRVLAALGAVQPARADALYEQRGRLSPYGLAQLALALGPDDPRGDTLVTTALEHALHDRTDEARRPSALRAAPLTVRTLGALLEAASGFEVGHARAGEMAGRLLASSGGTPRDRADMLVALAAYAEHWRWEEGAAPRVHLDGTALPSAVRSRGGARFTLPLDALRGAHRLRIAGADEGAVFYAIDGRWAVPLGEPDTIARGRRVAVHRVYETPDGRVLEDGAAIPLGSLVRVRLFVYTEGTSPDMVALTDPLPAGFEAVDAEQRTTPHGSLMALMGMGPDDDSVDSRAHHAMRSLGSIAHRSFATEATHFYFDQLPYGLAEYTYAIRATAVGTFTAPPSQLEAFYDPAFVARSAMSQLVVVEREPE